MQSEDPIVVARCLEASVDRVWRAITDPQQMPRWFFEQMRDFRPERGFETRFTVFAEGKDYVHHWRVTEVEPKRRIVYDWLYPGFAGASLVSWDLAEVGDGTRLTLTHTGTASFPRDERVFGREACQGGWEYFFGRLERFLAGGALEDGGRRRIPSGSPYEATIGFSRALRVGSRILVSGTAPIWPDGSCNPDPESQALRCFEIIGAALREAGAEPRHVVRTRMYLTDAAHAEAVARAHGAVLGDVRPAATMVVVAGLLDPRWKVEIEAEAVVDS
jgi:uncharacterized protein YndB with AHSA1/START domain